MSRSNAAAAALALTLVGAGCAQPTPESHADDFVPVAMSGEDVELALDDQNQTIVYEADQPFVRVGVMWDHVDPTPAEIRMRVSADDAWTEWTPVEVIFTEEESHAGHLDAPGGLASFYQVRFPAGAPTAIAIEPILEVPDLSAEPPPDGYDPDEDDPDLGTTEGDVGSSQEALTMGSFAIHSRRSWGARPPRCRDRGPTPTRATIHHTVTPNSERNPQRRLRLIQAFHMDTRGWCDIGYNYLVSADGRVWRGRGALYLGAHVENANSGNVGISFMGTHTSTPASLTQLRQAARLLVRLRRRGYPISLGSRDIKGHRDFGGTSCPGDALYRQIPRIIRLARSI